MPGSALEEYPSKSAHCDSKGGDEHDACDRETASVWGSVINGRNWARTQRCGVGALLAFDEWDSPQWVDGPAVRFRGGGDHDSQCS